MELPCQRNWDEHHQKIQDREYKAASKEDLFTISAVVWITGIECRRNEIVLGFDRAVPNSSKQEQIAWR
jgi:hypothetical protein